MVKYFLSPLNKRLSIQIIGMILNDDDYFDITKAMKRFKLHKCYITFNVDREVTFVLISSSISSYVPDMVAASVHQLSRFLIKIHELLYITSFPSTRMFKMSFETT